jgi:hypothetical protein
MLAVVPCRDKPIFWVPRYFRWLSGVFLVTAFLERLAPQPKERSFNREWTQIGANKYQSPIFAVLRVHSWLKNWL